MSAWTGARPRRPIVLALALAGAALALRAGPALAHSGAPDEVKPQAAGPADEPDPGAVSGLRVLAHLAIPHARPEVNSDVWKLGDTVLVGYRCGGDGSALIDVADPTNPRLVARTVAMPGTFANDVKAIRLDGPDYAGDVFIEPHDTCTTSTVSAKTRFWAIDDPAQPKLLATLETVNGVHNVHPFHRDGRAYLLMALPAGDTATNGVRAGFAIAEITDPRNPTIVGTYNLRADLGDVPGNDFLHDAWASADGRSAYLSWWDAGMLVLDITDLSRPELAQRLGYYGQPDWYGPAAGNTHTTVPLADGRHVVITDEDFSVGEFSFEVIAPASEKRTLTSSQDDFLAPILGGGHAGTIAAALATSSDACVDRAAALRGRVALLDRSPRCTPAEQVAAAQEAGALAVVLMNADGGDEGRLEGWHTGLKIPAVQVSRATGSRLKTAVRSHVEVRVRLAAVADAWGFTRIADLAAPGGPRLIANITTANTDRFPPKDNGWYSVHNPMVVGDTLYLSHYADGVRVWDVSDPVDPFETAYFVPPDLPDGARPPLQGQIWGVYPADGLIYASDIASGLWILAQADLVTVPTPPPPPAEDPTLAPTVTVTDTPTPAPTDTPAPTEPPPVTALPGPAIITPTPMPTATVEPTSTSAPTPAPTTTAGAPRPGTTRLYLPLGIKPRRRG